MKVLLQTLEEILQQHGDNPIIVEYWPKRRTLCLSREEAMKEKEKEQEKWRYRGGFEN